MSTIFSMCCTKTTSMSPSFLSKSAKQLRMRPAKKMELMEEVHRELEMHTQFEEAEVYPAFQKAVGEEGELKDAVKEHREATQLLKELTKSVKKGEDSDWKSHLKELEKAIKPPCLGRRKQAVSGVARLRYRKSKAEKMASEYRAMKKKVAAE